MIALFVLTGALMTGTAADESAFGTLDAIRALNPHLNEKDPRELPMKLRSLRAGPYEFFRGTAELYYQWCESNCGDWVKGSTGRVQLHGDIHPGNTGTFCPEGEGGPVYFSLVDLDETFRGAWQLDLLRAATSLRFAAVDNKLKLEEREWERICSALCRRYAKALLQPPSDASLQDGFKIVRKLLEKATEEDQREHFDRFVAPGEKPLFRTLVMKKGRPADLLEPLEGAAKEGVSDALWQFLSAPDGAPRREILGCESREKLGSVLLDAARWVRFDSSGSQGVHKYLVLLRVAGNTGREGLLILQFKEEPSPAAVRAGLARGESLHGRGEAVAKSHSALQGRDSTWVGWAPMNGREFLIKPKGSRSKEPSQKDLNKRGEIEEMAEVMGALLGRGHAASLGGDTEQVRAIHDRAGSFAKEFESRSLAVFEHLMSAYEDLKADKAAHAIAQRAEQFIQIRSTPAPDTRP